jgi:hypothetical protein
VDDACQIVRKYQRVPCQVLDETVVAAFANDHDLYPDHAMVYVLQLLVVGFPAVEDNWESLRAEEVNSDSIKQEQQGPNLRMHEASAVEEGDDKELSDLVSRD